MQATIPTLLAPVLVAGLAPQGQAQGPVPQRTLPAVKLDGAVTRNLGPWASRGIGEGRGGFRGDLSPGDYFGRSLCPLGDFNGDGTPDLAVLASGHGSGGALWLLFLDRTGAVIGEQEISESAGGFTGNLGAFGSNFASVDCLGDVDGDGVVDLAVGAPSVSQEGSVWILFLDPDGTVKSNRRLAGPAGSSYAGSWVAGPGDIDGDGTPDLAVSTASEVWILFLRPDGSVRTGRDLSPGSNGFPVVPSFGGSGNAFFLWFGTGLDGLGDFDGNGVPDLLVGAREWLFEGGIGHVWLVLSKPTGASARRSRSTLRRWAFGPSRTRAPSGTTMGASEWERRPWETSTGTV